MVWAIAIGMAGGVLAGAGGLVLAVRLGAPGLPGWVRRARVRQATGVGRWRPEREAGGGDGRTAITTDGNDPRGGLARKSLDSLRVGVVVLDPNDQPVLVNPSARAMGLLRVGSQPGTIAAHPVVRSLAAHVRRSGVRREVELDLPRGGEDGAAGPLGVLLRGVGLGGDRKSVV